MTTFSETDHPRVGDGSFTDKAQSAPELALLAGVDLTGWTNGMNAVQPELVTVIESPVSDREHNYFVTLKDGAGVTIDVFLAGIQDDDSYYGSDREQLYIGRDGDDLVVQFSGEEEDFSEIAALLDDDDRIDIEEDVRAKVAEMLPGTNVEFTNSDNWDFVQGLYTLPEAEGTVEPDGDLSITTSNAMAALEAEPGYGAVRDGAVQRALRAVLAERDVAY
jgi:hypothetical protein